MEKVTVSVIVIQTRKIYPRNSLLVTHKVLTRVAHWNNRLEIVTNQRNLISIEASNSSGTNHHPIHHKIRLDKPVVIPKQQFPSRIPAVKSRRAPYNQHRDLIIPIISPEQPHHHYHRHRHQQGHFPRLHNQFIIIFRFGENNQPRTPGVPAQNDGHTFYAFNESATFAQLLPVSGWPRPEGLPPTPVGNGATAQYRRRWGGHFIFS